MQLKNNSRHIVVVGAGPGGLTSAMILAHRGFRVTVVEKAGRVGGRNAELRAGDFSFDTGPTFLHQRFTLDEVFAEAGRDLDEELELVLLDQLVKVYRQKLEGYTSVTPESVDIILG